MPEMQSDKPKFDPDKWAKDNPLQAFLVSLAATLVLGIGSSIVTSKAYAQKPEDVQGISQSTADSRYLSITEANRRTDARNADLKTMNDQMARAAVVDERFKTQDAKLDGISATAKQTQDEVKDQRNLLMTIIQNQAQHSIK